MSKKHKKYEHKKSEKKQDSSDDEIKIDFSKIKEKTSKAFSGLKKFNKSKYSKTILITTLIVLIILISTIYRVYPASLPIAEEDQRNQLRANVINQFISTNRIANPSMTDAQILAMSEQNFSQFYSQNKDQFELEVQTRAQSFRDQVQDENGQTYLLAIDPYLWYSYAKWYDRTGFFGNEIIDGEERFTLRNGNIGTKREFIAPAATTVFVHRIIQIFNPDQDIFSTHFFLPVILIGIAIIPAFFLGKKFGGIPGGFFAATIFALSAPILGRTSAGFSDTDAYTFIFPFLIIWLFLESVDAKTLKNRMILSSLTGLSIVLFKFFWSGWWFTFDLLLGLAGVLLIYNIIVAAVTSTTKERKKDVLNSLKTPLTFIVIFFVSAIIFGLLLSAATNKDIGADLSSTITAPLEPLNFVLGFKGAAEGIGVGGDGLNYPLWPNVLTTVAELNAGNTDQVIAGGGGLWLIVCAILGAILLFFKMKEGKFVPIYGILLIVWLISTFYAGLVGVRFIALFAPVVAFGIAGLIGMLTGPHINKIFDNSKIGANIFKTVAIVVFILLLIIPQITDVKIGETYILPKMTMAHDVAKNEIPSYDDTWEAALKTINEQSDKAVISSWWDFGHWFEARSERSVTFDGGDQGKRIYWIGKTLLTSDEDESVDILKMLNCGQEESFNLLQEYTKDKLKATRLIKQITREEKETAQKTLISAGLTNTQVADVLEFSHCEDYSDMYFITSEDMTGKSAVWGHFGSWDFDRAYMYYKLSELSLEEAMAESKERLELTQEQAKPLYFEALKIREGENAENVANAWISPWPGYLTGNPVTCQEVEDLIGCEYNAVIGTQNGAQVVLWRILANTTNPNASQVVIRLIDQNTNQVLTQQLATPTGIVFGEKDEIKRFEFDNPTLGFDFGLFKDEEGNYRSIVSDPLLSQSMYTKLFFLDGQYTEHFEKVFDERSFRNWRIIVWKVNP